MWLLVPLCDSWNSNTLCPGFAGPTLIETTPLLLDVYVVPVLGLVNTFPATGWIYSFYI